MVAFGGTPIHDASEDVAATFAEHVGRLPGYAPPRRATDGDRRAALARHSADAPRDVLRRPVRRTCAASPLCTRTTWCGARAPVPSPSWSTTSHGARDRPLAVRGRPGSRPAPRHVRSWNRCRLRGLPRLTVARADRDAWRRLYRRASPDHSSATICQRGRSRPGRHPSVEVVPNSYPDPGPRRSAPGEAPVVLFAGHFPYRPNADAAGGWRGRSCPVRALGPGHATATGRQPDSDVEASPRSPA